MDEPTTIGVIGLGAFGGLLARVLAGHASVLAHDPSEVPTPEGVRRASLAETAGCPVVVLAVNVQHLPEAIEAVRPHLPPGALVADVCSVKLEPLRLLTERLPPEVRILGTHPLFGPQTVAERGLPGQKIALCPARIEPERAERVRRFLTETLRLRAIEVTPDEHDRQMTYVQVLTHLIGHAGLRMDLPELPLATVAYERLLQLKRNVEKDSPELFEAIQRHNPWSTDIRRRFREVMRDLVGDDASP